MAPSGTVNQCDMKEMSKIIKLMVWAPPTSMVSRFTKVTTQTTSTTGKVRSTVLCEVSSSMRVNSVVPPASVSNTTQMEK